MWQQYLQPTTVDETLQLLAQHRETARLINGGTDLLIEIERKLRAPSVVIDVSRVTELDDIHVANDVVHIGAGVTHNQIVAYPILRARAYALVRACWEVGAPQIRNRGTLAGNLVTASPANDTIPPLWALGATVTLRSVRGERTLTFPEFFMGVRKTALASDEMLTVIALPLPSGNTRSTFLKLGLRRAQAISVVNVAVALTTADGGRQTTEARIALGSVAPTIVEATEAQGFLIGKALMDDVIDEASRLAMNAASPIDDVRGTAAYRRDMVRVFVARALRQMRDGTERDDFPAKPIMLWGKRPTPNSQLPTPNLQPPISHIETIINGKDYSVASSHDKTLLRFLREDLRLVGTKEGCAEGECGACTIFLDGIAVMSCLVPAARAHGATITTIEGLSQRAGGIGQGAGEPPTVNLHPLQRAFIDEFAVQCGYCTPGFIMSGAKLLEEVELPTRADIQQAITGNLCRCTGYAKILRAMEKVTSTTKEDENAD